MNNNQNGKTAVCHICKKHKSVSELSLGSTIRPSLGKLIKEIHPDWDNEKHICHTDISYFRHLQLKDMLEKEKGELSKIDREVIRSLTKHEVLSENVEKEFHQELSFSDRLSDKLALFGGSWKFIIFFVIIIIAWIGLNAVILLSRPFDPYPFILLNLILSCVAALQAPIIMMSQRRQEARDRLRGMHDYKIDLKAELEIRNLHEKLDHLVTNQWQRLLEIQQMQVEMLEEMKQKIKSK